MTFPPKSKPSYRKPCHAGRVTTNPCREPADPVTLLDPSDEKRLTLPGKIYLCSRHRLELMERGVRAFVEKYPVRPVGKQGGPWEKNDVPASDVVREVPLSFIQPDYMESLIHARTLNDSSPDYSWREEFAHFKDTDFKLEQVDLTDKQLTAVCLVFFGGVQRKRAARAMKISNQALGVHIKAALKKIEQSLCQ